ncbi:PhrK family phosphatase-inhibitory pheromone [Bacillus subtilis]|uniref:Uncharacterized protein n=1 Tax=Bacillus phage FADO TaxID=2917160 RepID=A0AAE9G9Q1_9CAUD|nr:MULTISPECIES: PhrK family phosphatase-inhibitory pheromone [Bacillus subtilis group]YP_010740103.1 hypothetical protein P9294_gp086 [Bacillus phage FADO]MCR4362120.1 PhrK family phosphatase-inhibitory pheromone [Bacillus subtilis]UNY48801.1 hypothetical protein fado_86 [Bacillus phage FADO]UQB84274.1 PhrK family phosphatase-inhibitory pheromone [Bacillus amyloliquefaciens]WOF32901.1 PhrK family phosphatase-inhibitory pheromone [Bacillus subtilis]
MKKLIVCGILTVSVLGLSLSYNQSSNALSSKEIQVAELPVGT